MAARAILPYLHNISFRRIGVLRTFSRVFPLRISLSLAIAAVAFPDAAAAAGGPASDPKCPAGQTYWLPAEGCVTLPVLRKRVEPDLVSTDPGADAEFVVLTLVKRDGHVGSAKVLATLPETAVIDAGTSRAITAAVEQWEFAPGRDTAGAPADMYLTLRVKLLFEEE
jgi:hypothetical protein